MLIEYFKWLFGPPGTPSPFESSSSGGAESSGNAEKGGFSLFSSGKSRKFSIGDRVLVKYRGQEGYIIDINSDYYMVSMMGGERVDSYTADELKRI